jgi:hypothetical protein
MGTSEAVRILSDGARQENQGVTAIAVTPFSFGCKKMTSTSEGVLYSKGHNVVGSYPPLVHTTLSLTGVVFVGKTKVNVCAGIVGQVFAADD